MSTRDIAIQRTSRKVHDIGSGASGTDNVLLSDTEIGEEVDAAVYQYSVDQPRIVVTDITAVTSPYFSTASLTGWANDWSRLLSLEWQAAAVGVNYQPTYLTIDDDVIEYQDGTLRYIYLPANTPASADITRFRYTAPHTLTNSVDTIPAPAFDACCDLAASYCCNRLQAKFAASSDPTIIADSVQYRDSQLRFKQAGEAFMATYRRKLALPEGGPAPASQTRDWDTFAQTGDRLFHRSRWR